ncbi:WD40-repeat-containing domain protein [Apiosordaria backusii]|uniref:WD40-repeat-containing domain protein n=1 Tax=Apiosordaria backusii TaxID=314023 RepID=A0AA40K7C7_9PEZI|nr:WD40-repeat-containing domain protein [Apiosordaria backusii]
MDRPEPGLIKWSPNASHDTFIHINLQHRMVQVYEPTGHAQRGRFEYRKIAKHDELPPLTTWDWSPSIPGLVAVGTSTGVVNLLRVDDNSNAYLELGLKMSRTCHAVAFNTTGKLAVALDRVRNDNCLYIWDVNRLSGIDSSISGFRANVEAPSDPTGRFEPSVSVSSVKFFEDNPNVLVAGIKGTGLRIHDLRGQHGPVLQFNTKCCNNLAIDYADPNYFASSALDQPGVMIWDRRAIDPSHVSPIYEHAVQKDGIPWGGALRLDHAVQMEADPALMDSKNSFIRSLRFCRDHPGELAILSRTGQLKVLNTRREYVEPEMVVERSPELLEVARSHEIDPFYADTSRKNDKIVSFDWITTNSPVLQPRILVLRANGGLDVLEKPSFTSEYPFKMVPWQRAHRGFEENTPYQDLMEFESSHSHAMLGPLVTEFALSDQPVFGPDKVDVPAVVEKTFATPPEKLLTVEVSGNAELPASFHNATTVADQLEALRSMIKDTESANQVEPPSQRHRHEKLLTDTMKLARNLPKARNVLDHIMLLRAKEGYLFNCEKNQEILSDDIWLKDVWAWVSGAQEAASDGGMMAHPLDIGYLGIETVWLNDLGSRPHMRLSDGEPPPDEAGWERCLNAINKKLGIPKYDGLAPTSRPHHREMCLEMCGYGRFYDSEYEEAMSDKTLRKDSTWYTMVAANTLFRGDTKGAVQVLKKASNEHPELLFVSLALQLIGKDKVETLDFDARVASKTDPYLRAISTIIATGDWALVADQPSLPLRDRIFVALRNFDDDNLSYWLQAQTVKAISSGDIEGIILTGITDSLVDILCCYVHKFNDFQTASLLLSICSPRFIDDVRATAFREAYRRYLQRHNAFYLRSKFDVESTKRSKHLGRPTVKPPGRQIALRCVYCDAETSISLSYNQHPHQSTPHGSSTPNFMLLPPNTSSASSTHPSPATISTIPAGNTPKSSKGGIGNPFTDKMISSGISCPTCKRHLPRCVVCLEVVGMPRSNQSWHWHLNTGTGGIGGGRTGGWDQ